MDSFLILSILLTRKENLYIVSSAPSCLFVSVSKPYIKAALILWLCQTIWSKSPALSPRYLHASTGTSSGPAASPHFYIFDVCHKQFFNEFKMIFFLKISSAESKHWRLKIMPQLSPVHACYCVHLSGETAVCLQKHRANPSVPALP